MSTLWYDMLGITADFWHPPLTLLVYYVGKVGDHLSKHTQAQHVWLAESICTDLLLFLHLENVGRG